MTLYMALTSIPLGSGRKQMSVIFGGCSYSHVAMHHLAQSYQVESISRFEQLSKNNNDLALFSLKIRDMQDLGGPKQR